jgi:hypothetical protein
LFFFVTFRKRRQKKLDEDYGLKSNSSNSTPLGSIKARGQNHQYKGPFTVIANSPVVGEYAVETHGTYKSRNNIAYDNSDRSVSSMDSAKQYEIIKNLQVATALNNLEKRGDKNYSNNNNDDYFQI